MNSTRLLAHFLPPLAFAVFGLARALRLEPLTVNLAAHTIGAGLFYAAPHILWAGLCFVIKPSKLLTHTGFAACSAVLLLIGGLSFVSHDPSGLPYQWLVYWPLAALALVLVLLSAWVVGRRPRTDA